jgi:hypothetical protein
MKKQQRLLAAKCRQSSYCAKLAADLAGKPDLKLEDIEIKKRKKAKVLTEEFKENYSDKKKNVQIASEFQKDIWTTRMATDGNCFGNKSFLTTWPIFNYEFQAPTCRK